MDGKKGAIKLIKGGIGVFVLMLLLFGKYIITNIHILMESPIFVVVFVVVLVIIIVKLCSALSKAKKVN